MRTVMVALIAATMAQGASAQIPYAPLEPGTGLNSRGGGAAILEGESIGRWGSSLTPTMQRQRTKQIAELRAEAIRRSAANGGALSDDDRDQLSRMTQKVVGVRGGYAISDFVAR